jgi:hypothetical protein
VDGVDDLGVVDALQVDRGDAEVAVPELALDHHERDAFVRELDGVGMSQLVRGKAAPDTSGGRSVAQLAARLRSTSAGRVWGR